MSDKNSSQTTIQTTSLVTKNKPDETVPNGCSVCTGPANTDGSCLDPGCENYPK
jgi:hypothetical protein